MMPNAQQSVRKRTVQEWTLHSNRAYREPFTDVTVDAHFTDPNGAIHSMPAFYAGDSTWIVRFNPGQIGTWNYVTQPTPPDPELEQTGQFTVIDNDANEHSARGFLRAPPGKAWGFHYENGEPAFIMGDTLYNFFGMAHCGYDVDSFLARRADQGFNLLRIRVPCSPFHHPEAYSHWQTKRTWAWGGSEQEPRFDRFNLDYFATIDRVVARCEELGLGIEMIMEAWGFEFPFNSRQIFVPEWEELWMRYLIARYDAYNCLYVWTPLNEYEYYPNGNWHYQPVADRWAMRIARWIKATSAHNHIVAMHNGPREPAFSQRFAADPGAVDAIMYQEWGTRDQESGWLAAGIEEKVHANLGDWWGSAILAEYGYERNPALPLLFPGFEYCRPEHMRRAPWRGAFLCMGVIHGFENTWGPHLLLDEDQPSLPYLQHLKHFFTEVLPFFELRPAPELIVAGPEEWGHSASVLATDDRSQVAVYLPAGGQVHLDLARDHEYTVFWFDPRTGQQQPTEGEFVFSAPGGQDANGHPWDWVLVLR